MQILKSTLKLIGVEFAIVFTFHFLINEYLCPVTETIKADAVGYYDYLPSIFIHHDLNRHQTPIKVNATSYERIEKLGVYNNYQGFVVDKYPIGTALLQLPFFYYTYKQQLNEKKNTLTGYEQPFHLSVYYAALFYMFLGLIFLKKVLKFYQIKDLNIFFCQFLILFATNLVYYISYDAGFSHIYSFFAISAWLYFSLNYFSSLRLRYLLLSCVFFALILLLRQANVLIILFVPFLMGSKQNMLIIYKHLLSKLNYLLLGLLICFFIFFIQMFVWYLQTGDFFLYSYQNEGFDFLHPEIMNVLFSFRKGLFVYTPILLVAFLGIMMLFYKKDYFRAITWLIGFGAITYFISSWSCWYYGCSFGMRAYLEYYPLFFIPIAIIINELKSIWRWSLIILCFFCIPLNCIQVYQYKNYILHWIDMDQQKYWRVFLKTQDRFRGLIWEHHVKLKDYRLWFTKELGDFKFAQNSTIELTKIRKSNEFDFKEIDLIVLNIEHSVDDQNDTKIGLLVSDTIKNAASYYQDPYLLQFTTPTNPSKKGRCDFVLTAQNNDSSNLITLIAIGGSKPDFIKKVSLEFYKKKNRKFYP